MKVPVLYVSEKSLYKNDARFDCYDVVRNAYSFSENVPVIAHPPCRLFGRLRKFSTAPKCEKFMAYSALAHVRRCGGVLEHPLSSTLWKDCSVGTPLSPDAFGGFLVRVDLKDFDFPAQKPTGLYIVGVSYKNLPSPPLSFSSVDMVVSSSKKSVRREIPKNKRSETPEKMIDYLYQIIGSINIDLVKFR